MSRNNIGLAATFGVPLLLAVLGLIGLVGALLADGAWDGIGAGLLAVALLAVVRARLGHRAGRRPDGRSTRPAAANTLSPPHASESRRS